MLRHRTKPGKLQKPSDVILTHPIRLDEPRAQSDLASQFQYGLPQMIVVDHHDLRSGSTVFADLLQCKKNINCIENMVEKDVVKSFIQFKDLRVALYKMQLRVLPMCGFNHRVADFYANSVAWHHRCQEITGFAANLQDPLVWFHDVSQHAFELSVEVVIGANPFIPPPGNGLLMFPSCLTHLIECVRPPALPCANLRIRGNHLRSPALDWRACSRA